MLIKKVTFRIEESMYNQLKDKLSSQKEKHQLTIIFLI